jgi:hypothetical protein
MFKPVRRRNDAEGVPPALDPPEVPSMPDTKPGDDAPPGTPGTGDAPCPRCQGKGQFEGKPCPVCDGTGIVNAGVAGG